MMTLNDAVYYCLTQNWLHQQTRDPLAIAGFLVVTNYGHLLLRWTCCLCTDGQVVDTLPEGQPVQNVTSPDPNGTPSVTPPKSDGETQNNTARRSTVCLILWENRRQCRVHSA